MLATDAKRRWIDNVALHPDGAVAWSSGKSAFVRSGKAEDKSFDAPTTVGGLAFAPKGLRIAIAHYNGVSMWFPNAQAAPEFLEWKGSHHHPAFSPNGQFLVTAMQEPALHGWRVVDAKHMRMSGYSARVRSSLRNRPSRQEVTVLQFCFSTPRIIMHRWEASMTTPTPIGCSTSSRAPAPCSANRPCT